jgi:hypothetical protein
MDHNATFRKASLMGISPGAAARMRIRYLNNEVHESLSLSKHPINLLWCNEMMEEILFCTQKMQKPVYKNGNVDRITDADIEAARAVRADQVVEFVHGQAHAWCHSDRRPSLFFATRLGICICPVCDRKWSALDVLIDRDKMPFIDAVKALR